MVCSGIFDQLNPLGQCKKYGLPFWQCPQFLFLIMGLVIISAILSVYSIGNRFIETPQLVALLAISVAGVLFVISYTIIRSFERLAEANRLKTEFISIVSHQLRSPLSNLKWTIELLMSGKTGKVEESQTEFFRILKENSDRMAGLISDLLIVSRIETSSLPIKKEEVFLEELARKLISGFGPFAKASNVEIIFEPQPNLLKISADPRQVSQVMENLLDNAIRYVSHQISGRINEGRVEVKVFQKQNNIFFEIKDNGVGIPKEDQKYIFQKFFRSKNVLRHQTQGSGLGLYIAKAIIGNSGGKLGFKSQEGKGSTFWFSLPIK